MGGRQPNRPRVPHGTRSRFHIAGCSRDIGKGGVLVGRTQGALSNGRIDPTACPDGVPHTAPKAVTVNDAFPLPSPPKKKKKTREAGLCRTKVRGTWMHSKVLQFENQNREKQEKQAVNMNSHYNLLFN